MSLPKKTWVIGLKVLALGLVVWIAWKYIYTPGLFTRLNYYHMPMLFFAVLTAVAIVFAKVRKYMIAAMVFGIMLNINAARHPKDKAGIETVENAIGDHEVNETETSDQGQLQPVVEQSHANFRPVLLDVASEVGLRQQDYNAARARMNGEIPRIQRVFIDARHDGFGEEGVPAHEHLVVEISGKAYGGGSGSQFEGPIYPGVGLGYKLGYKGLPEDYKKQGDKLWDDEWYMGAAIAKVFGSANAPPIYFASASDDPAHRLRATAVICPYVHGTGDLRFAFNWWKSSGVMAGGRCASCYNTNRDGYQVSSVSTMAEADCPYKQFHGGTTASP